MPMTLFSLHMAFHAPVLAGKDCNWVAMMMLVTGSARSGNWLTGNFHLGLLQVFVFQLVGMCKAAYDEYIADQTHHYKQSSSHGCETQYPPQHDLAGANRLGNNGVQRAVLDIVGQAQRAKEQGHQ